MFNVNERSQMLHHVLITSGDKKRSSQNSAIKQNCIQKDCGQEYCKGKMRNYKGACLWKCATVSRNTDGEMVWSQDSTKLKRRCQLVVRLKAVEYYKGLLCYLSSYLHLLATDLWPKLSHLFHYQYNLLFLYRSVFNNCSHYLLLEVQAVEDKIYRLDRLRTCI